MLYYRLRQGTVVARDNAPDAHVTAYLIDRTPVGPLARYCQPQTPAPCAPHGMYSTVEAGVTVPLAVVLPPSVRACYLHASDFMDERSAPAMLSWLDLNGYSIVDLQDGLWLQCDATLSASESPLTPTTPNQFFHLRLLPTTQDASSGYVVDRAPAGPLGAYARSYVRPQQCCALPTEYDGRTILLPPDVYVQYRFLNAWDVASHDTWPGLLTWLLAQEYEKVDLLHAFGTTAGGYWIRYLGSDFLPAPQAPRVFARRALRPATPRHRHRAQTSRSTDATSTRRRMRRV